MRISKMPPRLPRPQSLVEVLSFTQSICGASLNPKVMVWASSSCSGWRNWGDKRGEAEVGRQGEALLSWEPAPWQEGLAVRGRHTKGHLGGERGRMSRGAMLF